MSQNKGVPASPSGCQPTASAASSTASSQSGIPNAEDVDAAVTAWHMGAGEGLSLNDYLGWSWDEYVAWVRNDHDYPRRPLASAIEAAAAGETTKIGSTEGESAIPKGDAQTPFQPQSNGSNNPLTIGADDG